MRTKEKIKDFRKMRKEELLNVLSENQEKLRQLKFNLSEGKVKNVREIRMLKKDIARMKTILKSS